MLQKTIKQLADELHISKTAVRNYMAEIENFRNLYTKKAENGTIFIYENGCELLKSRAERAAKQFSQSPKKDRKEEETTAKQFVESENIEFFKKQIAIKDKQIEMLQQLLNQEQALHAQDLKRLAAYPEEKEKQPKEPEQKEPVKKLHWWNRKK